MHFPPPPPPNLCDLWLGLVSFLVPGNADADGYIRDSISVQLPGTAGVANFRAQMGFIN